MVEKQVLSEQYNEDKVKSAKTQTDSLEQTELVKYLTDKLVKYKLCNDGLKDMIKEICEKDRTFIANDPYSQDTKKADVSSIISRYFYDYPSFSFADYPYLSDIVLEIMKRKQKDANTKILDLPEKL